MDEKFLYLNKEVVKQCLTPTVVIRTVKKLWSQWNDGKLFEGEHTFLPAGSHAGNEFLHIPAYLDAQKAVPCKEGDFELPSTLEGMKEYIKEGKMSDYQDHYYPSEMAVDAQIQTFLMKKDSKAFLKKFDTDWVRYNRDIIRKVEDYEKSHND